MGCLPVTIVSLIFGSLAVITDCCDIFFPNLLFCSVSWVVKYKATVSCKPWTVLIYIANLNELIFFS